MPSETTLPVSETSGSESGGKQVARCQCLYLCTCQLQQESSPAPYLPSIFFSSPSDSLSEGEEVQETTASPYSVHDESESASSSWASSPEEATSEKLPLKRVASLARLPSPPSMAVIHEGAEGDETHLAYPECFRTHQLGRELKFLYQQEAAKWKKYFSAQGRINLLINRQRVDLTLLGKLGISDERSAWWSTEFDSAKVSFQPVLSFLPETDHMYERLIRAQQQLFELHQFSVAVSAVEKAFDNTDANEFYKKSVSPLFELGRYYWNQMPESERDYISQQFLHLDLSYKPHFQRFAARYRGMSDEAFQNVSLLFLDALKLLELEGFSKTIEGMEFRAVLVDYFLRVMNSMTLSKSAEKFISYLRYMQVVLSATKNHAQFLQQVGSLDKIDGVEIAPYQMAKALSQMLKFIRETLPAIIERRENLLDGVHSSEAWKETVRGVKLLRRQNFSGAVYQDAIVEVCVPSALSRKCSIPLSEDRPEALLPEAFSLAKPLTAVNFETDKDGLDSMSSTFKKVWRYATWLEHKGYGFEKEFSRKWHSEDYFEAGQAKGLALKEALIEYGVMLANASEPPTESLESFLHGRHYRNGEATVGFFEKRGSFGRFFSCMQSNTLRFVKAFDKEQGLQQVVAPS